MKPAFVCAAVAWVVVAVFHVRRFTQRRPGGHIGQLLAAGYALGWAAYCLREGHVLPLAWAAIPAAAAFVLGAAGAALCLLTWTVEALRWWEKRKWARR